MELKFWGVRGSLPTPVRENLRFGGNTTCLELRTGGDGIVVIDGGTGVRNLGLSLEAEYSGQPLDLAFLLTHFHWDHIQGIPSFGPMYDPASRIAFYAGKRQEETARLLTGLLSAPYHPVPLECAGAQVSFAEAASGVLAGTGVLVEPFPLHHPQGATGFRLSCEGGVVVHACDHEHGNAECDRALREHAEGADVLVYDAQFTPEEYASRRGWGHSTWLEGARAARDARVKQLVLTHHDPSHSDAFLLEVLELARREFENTVIAEEGTSIRL